ncbi:MAG: LacI family DNA-binding transcriptional regulator [Lachnospiraceae bacterium]|nr:LacI family DNA-binding transcriptional regulator [Lachnospiraceae bacterium]
MNISDIAEMAGVSRAAVSRYLNHGYISAEKSERIKKVIEETGYKPSIMAQTLRTKKTRLIGVILPRINSDTISSVVAGIGNILCDAGYEMILATTMNRPDKELDYLRIFSENRVDGVIFLATVFTREHKKLLKHYPIPIVIVGQRLDGVSCIYHDDYHAGQELARLMEKKGRKKICYIGVIREDAAVGRDRADGVRSILDEKLVPELRATADFSIKAGYEKMKELIRRSPEIDGVICATDSIAVGAMKYLKEQGISVPEQISVCGFGDNKISAETTPALTTVHFYYQESGEKAARKILEMLSSKSNTEEQTKLGYELIARESVSDNHK